MIFFRFLILLGLSLNLEARHLPGGEFTSGDLSTEAFNHPVSNADFIEKQQFGVGNSFFKQAWVEFPSSTVGRDGLGPTFNAIACAACHVRDGRGQGYNRKGVNLSMLFRLSQVIDGEVLPHPEYGGQFQPLGISDVKGEGKVDYRFEYIKGTYPDGTEYELRKPHFEFSDLKHSLFDDNTLISARVAPHLAGLGFIEAVDPADILAWEDPDDLNDDGVTGKANWVWNIELQKNTLGLFGWKAGQPSLRQQNAAAFNGDMGLTTSLFSEQNCPLIQLDCLAAPASTDLEVTPKVLDRVTLYTQLIAVPQSRNSESDDFKEGQNLFTQIRCNSCHRDSFRTGDFHPMTALHNQDIKPYSDFLVHDMGEDLADHRPEERADGREWRTPPLWSIGLFPTINRHNNLLHDGRARGVEEAILWHGGEAEKAKVSFMSLNLNERNLVIQFVESI